VASLFTSLRWVTNEGKLIVAREILKWILFALFTLASAWALGVVGNILHVSGPTWGDIFAAIEDATIRFFRSPIQFSIQAYSNNPIYAFIFLILIAGNVIFFILLVRSNRRLHASSIERSLAIQAGLGGRWPHALLNDPQGAPWDELCAAISRGDNHHLYILGANGIDTFGDRLAPLYDVMETSHAEMKIVLIHPDSPQLAGRATAVGIEPRDYKRAIRTSEQRLRDLKRQHHAIEGRFYDGQPNWKMIITTTTVWVQYYAPGRQHVNQTPVWRFDATPAGDGLYHLFRMEFDRIWRRCEGVEMHLS
jgi:hypothetical protein